MKEKNTPREESVQRIFPSLTLSPIREDSTCALLRQGNLEGWTRKSYLRVADYFDKKDPIACLFWVDLARRCHK